MEVSLSTHQCRVRPSRGFTLLEVVVAIFVLAFGMLAVAWLINRMNLHSVQSRYMTDEALLASEKLEDLNRYPSCDPWMVAGGSLTADTSQTNGPTAPCVAPNEQVDYFDQVQISVSNGLSTEIMTGQCGAPPNAQAGYWTITHKPNGTASSFCTPGAPPNPTADMLVFKRRWVIEANQPITGVRRITVLVTLNTPSAGATGTFQTSMVRP